MRYLVELPIGQSYITFSRNINITTTDGLFSWAFTVKRWVWKSMDGTVLWGAAVLRWVCVRSATTTWSNHVCCIRILSHVWDPPTTSKLKSKSKRPYSPGTSGRSTCITCLMTPLMCDWVYKTVGKCLHLMWSGIEFWPN